MHNRRLFLGGGVAATCAIATSGFAPAAWTRALDVARPEADSPYGPLGAQDANGLRLPAGFTSRRLATSGSTVAGTGFKWHADPDGGACFARADGGWVYVSNCETSRGGASALRFNAAGAVVAAYTILGGTDTNCAGGPTPWGTWLSCEETPRGRVWECNPQAAGQGIARPALGRFEHEAAAVDPATGWVYLTEDNAQSRLYRFRPERAGDLSAGVLEAAFVAPDQLVSWVPVSPKRAYRGGDTTAFARGEGAFFDNGVLYFSTTTDDRIWALHAASNRIAVVYDAAPLRSPDNITVHRPSGDVFVAEDGDNIELVLLADAGGTRIGAPFLEMSGHRGSEVTGPAFSPDGRRLYLSSQTGMSGGNGMTFEITGPFRNV